MSLVENSPAAVGSDVICAAPPSHPADGAGDVARHLALGRQFSERGRFSEAEVCFRRAIEAGPDNSPAYNNLGWVRAMQGADDEAIGCYEQALQLDAGLRIARRNLATLLVRLDRREQSLCLWHQEMQSGAEGVAWIH